MVLPNTMVELLQKTFPPRQAGVEKRPAQVLDPLAETSAR
jgi:hypothetical protein